MEKKHLHTKLENFLKEGVTNLSKIRKWKINTSGVHPFTDMYFVYDLKKSERGEYLNTWFEGIKQIASEDDRFKVKIKREEMEDFIIRDEVITLKKTDDETSSKLYHKEYNPISINIMPPIGAKFRKNEKGEKLYIMKAKIHSVDDSSFGIWWDDKPLSELESDREKLMKWVNAMPEINGEEFLDTCISLGADESSKDYN